MRKPTIVATLVALLALTVVTFGVRALGAPQSGAAAPAPAAPGGAEAAPLAKPAADPVLWPEAQRAFLQDGPALLLSDAQRAELLTADEDGRRDLIATFLGHDPDPATPLNELAEGIERRRQLVAAQFQSPRDVRAQLLFLDGPPAERLVVDCGVAFKPLEIWSYAGRPGGPGADRPGQLVVYQPTADSSYRLWVPLDSKRVLYTSEMEYWLEQWDENRGRISGRRFDRQVCDQAKKVDEVTGVRGLRDYQQDRPTAADYERFLAPPDDLAAWAAAAAATSLPEAPPRLPVQGVEVVYPRVEGQRTQVRTEVDIPPDSGVEPYVDAEKKDAKPELRFTIDAVVEENGRVFSELRSRYRLAPPSGDEPLALIFDQALRPEHAYLLRLRVRDEVGGAQADLAKGFLVPREPTPQAELKPAEELIAPLEAQLAGQKLEGKDSLLLVPPETEVVFGLWRAEALVSGARIVKVVFSLDGKVQLTRARPPYTAELRLADVPTQQVVRAEGYDDAGALVASDEVVLNQTHGAFAVEITDPKRGFTGTGKVTARAEVTVPEERRVERVEFRLNNELVATLEKPPWTTEVEVPAGAEITYLSAVAVLDDGRSAEAVRFLNAPRFLEQVDVRLVELYVAVVDHDNRPVTGLGEGDFEVYEEGVLQQVKRFERVENLPLALGITIDTSGSMASNLGEAQRAGKTFLEKMMTPRDRCFVLGFSATPNLLMAPTDDARACIAGLDQLQAVGATALHDAVTTALYYFRGLHGQKALILLSDGDDTSSTIAFPAALEYARRSGVAIYPVGLGVTALSFNIRAKLKDLATETGGRAFFISKAEELASVYGEIEQELRSRYFIAYEASGGEKQGEDKFRNVEVKVKQRGLSARTIRGYYP